MCPGRRLHARARCRGAAFDSICGMIRHAPILAVILGGLLGCTQKTADAPATVARGGADPATGERIFAGNCAACHQQDARGIAGVYPSLVGSPVLLGDPKALALWVIKGRRPASMPEGRYPTKMLLYGWMKPADAAALFTYLRSHFGNDAPAIDAVTVAQALGP